MAYKESILDLIGNTPIIKLNNIIKNEQLNFNIFAKIEKNNPAGSIKDRVAKQMIIEAIDSGKLKKASTIIEPTSGNTGIGISAIASYMGYNVIIVMPENMSIERQKLMTIYGSNLVLTKKEEGMQGAINKANELKESISDSIILGQFDNEASVRAHLITGQEIYEDMNGNIDAVIIGIGTGGTITGIAKYLKSKNQNIKIFGIEPASSPFLTKHYSGIHKIQGIGAGFQPNILDLSYIDEIITIEDEEALEWGKKIAKEEGLLVGISSGANLAGAIQIGKRGIAKNIITIFPDTGERYLSTELFK